MSAYMVDRDHIVYLLLASGRAGHFSFWCPSARTRVILRPGDYEQLTKIGQMLWDENKKSINARYPDTIDHPENMPGVVGDDCILTEADIKIFSGQFNPIEIIKACHCYEYQSCKHDGWKDSDAKSFIKALIGYAIASLPGYEEAQWGTPESFVKQFNNRQLV